MPRRTSLTPLSDAISLCALTQEEAATLLSVGLPALRKMAQGAVNVPAWVMDKLAAEFLRVEAGTEDEGLTDHQSLRRRVIRDLRRRARRGKDASEVVRTPDGNLMTLEVRDAVVSEVEGGGHRIDCQVLLTCAGKSRQTRFQTGWDAEGERVVRDASAEIKLYGRKTNSVTIARSSWVSALRHVVPAWRGGEKSEANIGPDLDDLDDFLPEVLGRVGALLETEEHHLNPSLETIRKAVSAS